MIHSYHQLLARKECLKGLVCAYSFITAQNVRAESLANRRIASSVGRAEDKQEHGHGLH